MSRSQPYAADKKATPPSQPITGLDAERTKFGEHPFIACPFGVPVDLAALQSTLRQFAAERDWISFHTPKNLATALMVETAELAEIFQWMTPEQSQTAHCDELLKERIGDELADVLLYLLQLADHSQIDIKRAVGRKLVKNAQKHPSRGRGRTLWTSTSRSTWATSHPGTRRRALS